jgi:predicted Zn-ribbon and HTH transcriptional regulator
MIKCDDCKYGKVPSCYSIVGKCSKFEKFEQLDCIYCKYIYINCFEAIGRCVDYSKFKLLTKSTEHKNPNTKTKKSEILTIKEKIQKLKRDRNTRIDKSHIETLLHDVKMTNGYKHKFIKKFIDYLKHENLDDILIKQIKKFKVRKYNVTNHLVELDKENWDNFEEILLIVEEHYNSFKLYEQKKKLCHYTDWYKEMATEKTCPKCKSVNLIEAKYCNMCGLLIEFSRGK